MSVGMEGCDLCILYFEDVTQVTTKYLGGFI